jgi:hypothetical protein
MMNSRMIVCNGFLFYSFHFIKRPFMQPSTSKKVFLFRTFLIRKQARTNIDTVIIDKQIYVQKNPKKIEDKKLFCGY